MIWTTFSLVFQYFSGFNGYKNFDLLFFRKSEERLAKAHQRELDSLTAEHLRETQNMVHEFSRAQELLKDKVSALQIMYVLVHFCTVV